MHRLRTVIVDDNPEFLEAAAEIVRGDPSCELCGTAETGMEALALAGRQAPDLMLLDVHLDDLSGFMVADAIRAALPECRVLMMSLHDLPAYRDRSSEIGAVGFLAKSEFFTRLPEFAAALAAAGV